MNINIGGKAYNSIHEWAEEIKKDPNSTTLIWEYQNATTFINGKPQKVNGSYGKGKCWYKGKCYEGEIDYREDGIYVGGTLVQPSNKQPKQSSTKQSSTMEAKNYETLTLHGQGYTINANVINKLEVHGQGHTIRTKQCGNVEVHGMGNKVYKGESEKMSLKDCIDYYPWSEITKELLKRKIHILDADDQLTCNIPDNLLKKELENRGWTVRCTRTTTEEL